MLAGLKSKAAHTAKRAGLLTGGLLAICVGLAFLTAASWIYLSTVTDVMTAALIIGATYTGVGLLTVGIASTDPKTAQDQHTIHHAPHGPDGQNQQPPLMQAFLHGMQAGVSATGNRH